MSDIESFECDSCKKPGDIEDSVRIGKDLLFCPPCAWPVESNHGNVMANIRAEASNT